MLRTLLFLVVVGPAVAGCDEGTKSKAAGAAKKVDGVVDKLDTGVAADHLAKAKASVAAGTEPHEDCSWVASQTDTDATKATLAELRTLCATDVPLMRATAAVVKAEKARAEVPEAPTLTECQSDDWAQMKTKIEGSPLASNATWTDLKARWAKVCPDAK